MSFFFLYKPSTASYIVGGNFEFPSPRRVKRKQDRKQQKAIEEMKRRKARQKQEEELVLTLMELLDLIKD